MKQEQNTEFAGMEFEGIASDVIGYVKRERNTWRKIAAVLAVAVVIMSAVLAMVIM